MKPILRHTSEVLERYVPSSHVKKPHVAVLMGGLSEEREVSLVSGKAVVQALKELEYPCTSIDQGIDIGEVLQNIKPDVVFNALHGPLGEDGCIQGVLDMLSIPYTHSNVLSSALCMDKDASRDILMHHGIRMPEGVVMTEAELRTSGEPLPRPFVIKPVASGSSCGVVIVHEESDFSMDTYDFSLGEKFLVERYIPGTELTVSIYLGRPLCVTELRSSRGFYDYTSKYTDGVTEHIVPAPISASAAKELCDVALKAYKILGCKTVARADFRYDNTKNAEGDYYLLEINTQPGFTPLSLVPEQASYCGISFNQLVDGIIRDALNEGSTHYEAACSKEKAS